MDDPFERAEAQEVRLPYVGDDAKIGLCNVHQFLDVARMAGSHLYHTHLVLLLQPQQGKGHADGIVQIALRIENVEFLAKHGSNELFGCGFAIGASDADEGSAQLSAMMACQGLQGLKTVFHQRIALVIGLEISGVVNHYMTAACL